MNGVNEVQQVDPVIFKKGMEVLKEKIGTKEIKEANQILEKYKAGKTSLETKIIANEQWWKLRHWKQMKQDMNTPKTNENDPEPVSGWLFNSIIGKHADCMDSYPEPNILPRGIDDKEEAERLSSILPVVLEQNDFEETYSQVMWYKLKQGTGVYGVFWDATKMNGLGDISIKKIDLLNLFWEPGITDIQKSKNLFITEVIENDVLEQVYPQLQNKLSGGALEISKYLHDDSIDNSNKSVVVDWYYHTMLNGKKTLQYCKYVNDVVLYASENDMEPEGDRKSIAEAGWYEHGLYPVVFDNLFPEEGTCWGFGYIDVCKDAQKYIDVLNQAILKNACMGATPRYFARTDGSVNEAEFADWTKPIVHTNGNLGEDAIRQIEVNAMDSMYVNILQNKVEELKEVSGNRDVNNGGTTGGVTAASAIAAMQEASGRTSRDATKASYRAYQKVITLCIELVRQFYTLPRQFRISGGNGQEQYITYSNKGLQPRSQGNDFGVDLGYRLPVFDIKVTVQKQNPYNKLSQNELALQLYQLGMFNPQMSDQAVATLQIMDFDDKNKVLNIVQQNGTMYQRMVMMQQQMLQMAEIIDKLNGSNMAVQMAASITGQPVALSQKTGDVELTQTDPAGNVKEKNKIVEDARAQAQATSQPR